MAYGKYTFKQALIFTFKLEVQIIPINFGHSDKSGLFFRKRVTIAGLPIYLYFNLGINILQSAAYRYIDVPHI